MLRHFILSLLGVLVTSAALAKSCPPSSMDENDTDIDPTTVTVTDQKEIPEPDPPEEDPSIPTHPVPWDPMLEELKKQHETLKCIKEALETQNEALKSIVKSLGVIEKKICRLADEFTPESDDGSDGGSEVEPPKESTF